MRSIALIGAAAAFVFLSLTSPPQAADPTPPKMVELPDGLKYIDTKIGDGDTAVPGKKLTVHYSGWLQENGQKGKKFDSSVDRDDPFVFNLGGKEAMKGWEEGVPGMKVGGKRTLIIPPALAYGANGFLDVIPPNSTLIFDVELLQVR